MIGFDEKVGLVGESVGVEGALLGVIGPSERVMPSGLVGGSWAMSRLGEPRGLGGEDLWPGRRETEGMEEGMEEGMKLMGMLAGVKLLLLLLCIAVSFSLAGTTVLLCLLCTPVLTERGVSKIDGVLSLLCFSTALPSVLFLSASSSFDVNRGGLGGASGSFFALIFLNMFEEGLDLGDLSPVGKLRVILLDRRANLS